MTAPDQGLVLLLGSVGRPEDGWSVEDVFRKSAGALGDYASMLPDGELGDRSQWITYIARHAYGPHPDIVTLSRHTFDDWTPRHYDDQWRVAVRDGIERIRLPRIGYAEEARRSYEVFCRLRDEGVVRAGIRFLVALPLTESGVRAFVGTGRDFEILWEAYAEAMRREIEQIADAIPAEDLAIQWDLARETAAVEGIEFNFESSDLTRLPVGGLERYAHALSELAPAIPEDAWLGLHVCYGSLQHREGESPDSAHFTPIRDLGVGVAMLNRGIEACGRPVDFVHLPVQLSERHDEFYAPLELLRVGKARVYLGLLDPWDGVEGALERVEIARRFLPDFGVATVCGWGRRPPSETPESLLELNRALAEALR